MPAKSHSFYPVGHRKLRTFFALLMLATTASAEPLRKCVIAGQVEYRDYPCDNVPMKPGVSSWQWQQGLALPDTSIAPPEPQPYVAPDPNAEWNSYVAARVTEMRRREFIASRPSWGWRRGR